MALELLTQLFTQGETEFEAILQAVTNLVEGEEGNVDIDWRGCRSARLEIALNATLDEPAKFRCKEWVLGGERTEVRLEAAAAKEFDPLGQTEGYGRIKGQQDTVDAPEVLEEELKFLKISGTMVVGFDSLAKVLVRKTCRGLMSLELHLSHLSLAQVGGGTVLPKAGEETEQSGTIGAIREESARLDSSTDALR